MTDLVYSKDKKNKVPLVVILLVLLIPIAFGIFVVIKNLIINQDVPTQLYTLRDAMAEGYLRGEGAVPVKDISDVVEKSNNFAKVKLIESSTTSIKLEVVSKLYTSESQMGNIIELKIPEAMQKTPPKFDNVDEALILFNFTNDGKYELSDGYNSVFYVLGNKVYPANDVNKIYEKYIGKSVDSVCQKIINAKE